MDKTFRIRLAIVFVVIACIGVAVVTRAAFLMLLPSEKLQAYSDRQFKQDLPPKLPRRGQILDRNFEPFAVSVDVKSLYVNPAKMDKKTRALAAQFLAPVLKNSISQLKTKFSEKRGFVWIKRQLSDQEAQTIDKWLLQNRSLTFSIGLATESKRFYPNQSLASNLIGFTNIDSQGIEGLEYFLNKQLSGETGSESNTGYNRNNQVEANQVVLTIDKTLQNIVERELEEGIANTNAKNAVGIIMDASTGDILAMASAPNFNPNFPKQAPTEWHRNRAITDTYEPGSTMKTLMMAGGIEAGAFQSTTKVFCENGKMQIGKHWIREAEAKDKWGWLKAEDVLQKSSNIGSSKLGFIFGAEKYYDWLKKIGFTKKTGIDFPGEVGGYMPPLKDWAKIHLSNISFGQGISVTPIQMLRAYASIVNDGIMMQPRLIKEWRDFEGKTLKTNDIAPGVSVMKPSTAKTVQAMMARVPTTDGTAPKAAIPGFEIAGKTGTAQKVIPGRAYQAGKYIASFIGFAHEINPKYVVFVMVDEPKFPYFGGEAAAPVFRKIMSAALAKAGVVPNKIIDEQPIRYAANSEFKNEEKKNLPDISIKTDADLVEMPSLIGASAKQVMELFDRKAVQLNIRGSGVVVEQNPSPGGQIIKGQVISVRLENSD